MKQSIWKYPIEVKDFQYLAMPEGAQILCVQNQNGQPCIWAMVNESADAVAREIEIFGTGHPMPRTKSRVYVGTFQLREGDLVYHVFEKLI